MTPARITGTRIDSLVSKIERVKSDIDKMIIGDTRAADAYRIASLREAKSALNAAAAILDQARPSR